MIKKLVAAVTLILLLLTGIPAIASAHVLKVDGHIGAVLHINPDDNPTTGSPTDYIMSFDDDTGQFSLLKCNCTVSIIENGKVIAHKNLVVSSSEISEDRYTFLQPAVYIMRFGGTPKKAGAFQPFELNYEVRVTDGRPNAQPIPPLLWVGLGMGVGLLLLAAYARESKADQSK